MDRKNKLADKSNYFWTGYQHFIGVSIGGIAQKYNYQFARNIKLTWLFESGVI